MNVRPHTITLLTLGLLTLPQHVLWASASAKPLDAGETMTLAGMVRDFEAAHGDFNLTLPTGNGHYVGNVGLLLTTNDRPTLAAVAGYKVTTQWKDAELSPIGPHMYRPPGSNAIRVVNSPTITGNPVIDTFDSGLGPYGTGNSGGTEAWVTGSTMPVLSEPTPMPGLVNEVLYDGAGTSTLSSNLNCNKFLVRNAHLLQISGNITVLCHEEFKIENFARLQLLAGATLTLYVKKDATLQNGIELNLNTADPERLTIYNLGINEFIFENISQVYCRLISPNAPMHIKNGGQFYGNFTGKSMLVDNDCGLHIDTRAPRDACGTVINDTLGAKGAASTGGISSASTFAQWFTDIMGVNLSARHDITLFRDNNDVWAHNDDAFFPIDGRLFGNESMSHNFFFTYAVSTTFTHHACDGRFFEFHGADDAWLFIDGQLALDIGGLVPNQMQRIDVDRVSNLVDGTEYRLDFFYAQRNPSTARFHLRTNIDLSRDVLTLAPSAGVD